MDHGLVFVWHVGVIVKLTPAIVVAHVTKDSPRMRILEESLADFTNGGVLFPESPKSPIEEADLTSRLRQVKAALPRYDALGHIGGWNCETFANFLVTGKPASQQADFWNGSIDLGLSVFFPGPQWSDLLKPLRQPAPMPSVVGNPAPNPKPSSKDIKSSPNGHPKPPVVQQSRRRILEILARTS